MKKAAFAFLAVAACAAGAFAYSHRAVTPSHDGDREAYWAREIAEKGAQPAFEDLVRRANTEPYTDAHDESHAFGRALYNAMGYKGLAVCDPRPTYGCYHEIIGQYLYQYGDATLKQLSDFCDSQGAEISLTCKHAIGHGLLAAAAKNAPEYSLAALNEALKECDQVSSPTLWGGCHSGVFMEYDTRAMTSRGGVETVREPETEADWWSPCGAVAQKYVPQCVSRRPFWWLRVLSSMPEMTAADKIQRMGTYCEKFVGNDSYLYGRCMAGIGRMIPISLAIAHPTVADGLPLCRLAASTPERIALCDDELKMGTAYVEGDSYHACLCNQNGTVPSYCTNPETTALPCTEGMLRRE